MGLGKGWKRGWESGLGEKRFVLSDRHITALVVHRGVSKQLSEVPTVPSTK